MQPRAAQAAALQIEALPNAREPRQPTHGEGEDCPGPPLGLKVVNGVVDIACLLNPESGEEGEEGGDDHGNSQGGESKRRCPVRRAGAQPTHHQQPQHGDQHGAHGAAHHDQRGEGQAVPRNAVLLPLANLRQPQQQQQRQHSQRASKPDGGEADGEAEEGEEEHAGMLVCKQCGQWCADEAEFHRHKARKTCTKEPKCCCWPGCPKVFKHSHQLLYHVRVHTGERPYACQTCRAAFAQAGDLERHVRTHTGEKPFTCHLCGDSFAVSTTLGRHLRLHAGDRPHRCTFPGCDKTFIQRHDRDRHARTHSGERLFACAEPGCGKTFATRGDANAHQRRVHERRRQASGEQAEPNQA